jgi:hypothetical protein
MHKTFLIIFAMRNFFFLINFEIVAIKSGNRLSLEFIIEMFVTFLHPFFPAFIGSNPTIGKEKTLPIFLSF